MLVLRRKPEESLVINGTITVTILGVEGDRVKLGIQAPPEVMIVRQELLERARQVRQATGEPPAPERAALPATKAVPAD